MNFESLLTSEDGFALPAGPVQRAAARIIEGVPLEELAVHPQVVELVGGEDAIQALPVGAPPTRVDFLAAVRCGKTVTSVARGLHAALTADISAMRPGEVPRVVIVSLTKDHARSAFQHLVGTMNAKPALKRLIVGKPTAESVVIKQPKSGKPVELCVVALSEAGATVVAVWIIALVIDEYTRAPWDGVVRIQDTIAAARGRLVTGGQILGVGSPWAPSGPAFEDFEAGFGKPTADLVVLRGTGPMLNPSWWTPERCERLKRTDPTTYRTDVLGEFVDAEVTYLDSAALARSAKRAELALPRPSCSVFAAMDPATRGNGWTFAIGWVATNANGLRVLTIGLAKQWVGNRDKPLSPSSVLGEMASICKRYEVSTVMSDPWSFDSIAEVARSVGIRLVQQTAEDRGEMYQRIDKYVREEALSLPPDPVVLRDLQALRLRATTTGFRVELPTTPDGRHCDYAPAIALVALQADRALTGFDWFDTMSKIEASGNLTRGW